MSDAGFLAMVASRDHHHVGAGSGCDPSGTRLRFYRTPLLHARLRIAEALLVASGLH